MSESIICVRAVRSETNGRIARMNATTNELDIDGPMVSRSGSRSLTHSRGCCVFGDGSHSFVDRPTTTRVDVGCNIDHSPVCLSSRANGIACEYVSGNYACGPKQMNGPRWRESETLIIDPSVNAEASMSVVVPNEVHADRFPSVAVLSCWICGTVCRRPSVTEFRTVRWPGGRLRR